MQSAAKSPSVSEPDHLAANRFHMRRFTRHSGGLRPCLLVPPLGIASKTKLMHTPCRESPVKKALCTARHTDHLHSPPQALQSRHSPSADHRWKFEHIQPLYRDLSLRPRPAFGTKSEKERPQKRSVVMCASCSRPTTPPGDCGRTCVPSESESIRYSIVRPTPTRCPAKASTARANSQLALSGDSLKRKVT